jgi:trimeric autotransporter adhesin
MKTAKVIFFVLLLNLPCLGFAQTWQRLGTGMNTYPENLKVIDGKLYVVNVYEIAGDTVKGVAIFDGVKFDSLREIAGGVMDFIEYQNKKIVCGNFSRVGEWPGYYSTGKLAAWDSINDWHSLTPTVGIDFEVSCMAVYNGELYIGGSFTQVQNTPGTLRIAKWNGTSWSSVGGGFIGQAYVNAMTVYQGELYVGGLLGLPNGPNNNYYGLVKWNGTQWDSVGDRFGPGEISSLCVDSVNDVLYIGGGITYAGTNPVWSVAAWNGDSLYAPGLGITNGAYAMTMHDGKLWVGASAWSDTTLAYYDGTSWTAVWPAPNGTVTALADYQGNLYIGGWFGTVNGNYPARRIVCYGNTCPQSVGIAETTPQKTFAIYPNPAQTQLVIESKEQSPRLVVIRNLNGQEVYRGRFSQRTQIDISSFPRGMILVDVCEENGRKCVSERIILE